MVVSADFAMVVSENPIIISGLDIKVIVRDLDQKPNAITLNENATVQELYAKVHEELKYPIDKFELCGASSQILGEEDKDVTMARLLDKLRTANPESGSSSSTTKISLMVTKKTEWEGEEHSHYFNTADADEVPSFGTPATIGPSAAPSVTWQPSIMSSGGYVLGSSSSSYSPCKFVGLSNQGATCYMNSLLQSLYMTPEFREGVYRIPVVGDEGARKDSICFQLQCLFAQMQSSTARSVETTGLTRSFGWTGAEAFQQHDVQELCRVLFDELEERLKGSPHQSLITDLFQGTLESYVRNLPGGELSFNSIKSETFMDISLSIKQFGVPKPIASVEEGLNNFIKAETLDGNNRYQLDPDEKAGRTEKMMVDAHKGLQFADFPYILTLQLKRFDFDYNTMRRIKITDRVAFPELLDLRPYLAANPTINRRISLGKSAQADATAALKDAIASGEAGAAMERSMESEMDHEGAAPMNYQLYSVMVHSGSAFGGHYYAYIRSFDDKRWYKFNDSNVTGATWDEVEGMFGGGGGTFGISSSASAYMLLYRKVDAGQNRDMVPDNAIPDGLSDAIKEAEEAEKLEAERLRQERNRVSFTVHHGLVEKTISIDRASTYPQLIEKLLLDIPGLKGGDAGCVRLRKFARSSDVAHEVVGAGEDDLESSTVETLDLTHERLQVETRANTDTPWPTVDPAKVPVRVWVSEEMRSGGEAAPDGGPNFNAEPVLICVDKEAKVVDLKRELRLLYGVDAGDIVVVRAAKSGFRAESSLLDDNKASLKEGQYGRLDAERFFAARIPGGAGGVELSKIPLGAAVNAATNTATVIYTPPESEEPQAMAIDVSCTLADLKHRIAHVIGIPIDEFKVLRSGKELSNLKEALKDMSITWWGAPSRLIMEKGTPEKTGVHSVKVVLLDTAKQQAASRELCTMPVEEESSVVSVKRDIAQRMRDLKIEVGETEGIPHLRLRTMSWNSSLEPMKILVDEEDGKLGGPLTEGGQVAGMLFPKVMGVQILDAPESKTNRHDCVVELCRWKPSEWLVAKRRELLVRQSDSATQVSEALAEESGIDQGRLLVGKSNNWSGTARNELEDMTWKEGLGLLPSSSDNAIQALSLREGELYYYKEKNEGPKELTDEEASTAKSEVDEFKRARARDGGVSKKETGLTIKKGGADPLLQISGSPLDALQPRSVKEEPSGNPSPPSETAPEDMISDMSLKDPATAGMPLLEGIPVMDHRDKRHCPEDSPPA